MPTRANTQLRADFQARVRQRLRQLQEKARCGSVNKFITDDLKLVVATYHRFVTNLHPVTHVIAEAYLEALGFKSEERNVMLERVGRNVAESDSDIPALQLPPHVPSAQMPSPLTNLIGREDQITEVAALLRFNRLVTLVGAGGVGKTQLAIAVSHKIADQFSDGTRFVEFGDIATSSHSDATHLLSSGKSRIGPKREIDGANPVMCRLISALEVDELRGHPTMEAIEYWIGGRQMLFVLDNCEHVLDSCVELAQYLLSRCPHLCILATSRERMNSYAERVYRVPSLDFPPTSTELGKNSVSQLLEFSAVRLFVERSVSQGLRRRLTPSITIAIADICRQLDGIPLAIEMAASRSAAMSITEMRDGLTDRFNLLRGERNSIPRHETLRSLIDWSYDLLNSSEKALLQRLSVFVGGWTIEAASFVSRQTDANSIVDVLTALVNMSLVNFEDLDESGRYRLPETIRMYAATELVASGDYEHARTQHLAYYKQFAEMAEEKLVGPEQEVWMERVLPEYGNIRSALDWCIVNCTPIDSLHICGTLKLLWQMLGLYGEGRSYCAQALALPGIEPKSSEHAKVLNVMSSLAMSQGDTSAARAYAGESLAVAREVGSQLEEAMSLINLANVDLFQSECAVARGNATFALEIFKNINNNWGVAMSLNNLGRVANNEGDNSLARTYHEQSLALKREIGDLRGMAISLADLGVVAYLLGDNVAARSYHSKSLSIGRELRDWKSIASALSNLGLIASEDHDFVLAKSYHKQSLAIKREIGSRSGIAESLVDLGSIEFVQGDTASALSYFKQSLAIQREVGAKVGVASSLTNLGVAECAIGEVALARSHLVEALLIERDIGDRVGIAFTLEVFAGLALLEGQPTKTAKLLGAVEALREKVSAPMPSRLRAAYEEYAFAAIQSLGDEEFNAIMALGRELDLSEAIEFALSHERD